LSDDLSLSIASDGDESADCSVETVEEDSVQLQQQQQQHQEEDVAETNPSNVQVEVKQSIKNEIPQEKPKNNFEVSVTETLVGVVAKSSSLDVSDGCKELPSEETTTLKSPRSKKVAENNGEESGATIGTESEPEPDPPSAETGKKADPKRGNLIRRVSSSLRNVGKSASFKGSFRNIGKTASKIRQISRRNESDSGSSDANASSTPGGKEENTG
jgi:hypothetical protein